VDSNKLIFNYFQKNTAVNSSQFVFNKFRKRNSEFFKDRTMDYFFNQDEELKTIYF